MPVDILEVLRQGYSGQSTATPDEAEEDLNTMLAAGMEIGELPPPPKPSLPAQIGAELLRGVAAVPETAATLATGALAFPISGLAGAIASPFMGLEKAGELVPKVQEALTYQPIGETAMGAAELAAKPFEIIHESSDWWGQKVMEATGRPELGAAVAALIESAALLAGPKLGKDVVGISRSNYLKLRRKMSTAKLTGKYGDPGLVKALEEFMANAKANPALWEGIQQRTRLLGSTSLEAARAAGIAPKPTVPQLEYGQLPVTPRGPSINLPETIEQARRAGKGPTANEIVRARMERRRMAEAAGVELEPTGAKLLYEEEPTAVGEQRRLFGEEVTGKAEPPVEEPKIPTREESINAAVAEMAAKPMEKIPTEGERAAVEGLLEEQGVRPKKRGPKRATFESQAQKHKLDFMGEEPSAIEGEVVGRYYDPATKEYFYANTPNDVGAELKVHRENVLERTQKYAAVNYEDFGRLVDEWYKGGELDINAIREELRDFTYNKPENMFPTKADVVAHLERGEELLGIVTKMMRKRQPEIGAGGGVPPESGLVVAIKTGDTGEIFYGKPGQTHAELAADYELFDRALNEGYGFAGPDGEFLSRTEALEALPKNVQKEYKQIHKSANLEANDYLAAKRTAAELEDGNISEPKLVPKEERLNYMRQWSKQRSKYKQEQIEAMLEEGEDISAQLPPASRNAYRAYLETHEQALQTSEPRGIGEVLSDARTFLGDETGAFGDLGPMTHERRMALQRLVADAKRMVGDLTDYLTELGFTKEQIAIIKRHIDEIRKTDPETFGEPRQVWIDARAIAQGDKIVKQRKPGRNRQAPPVYASEVAMIQEANELPQRKMSGFENPIRTLEVADPSGNGLKQVYYDYREAEQLYRREMEQVREDIKGLREGVSWSSRKRIGAYAIAQQARGKNILAKMGVDVPQLTEFELRKYNDLRGKFEELFERINRTREMIGKEPIEKVDNYFTFFRTFGVLDRAGITSNPVLDKPQVIHSRYAKYGSTPFRFGIERIKKGAIPVELDVFRVFEKYNESALRHIHLSPWIAKMKELMLSLPDPKTGKMTWKLEHSKPNLYSFLSNWTNHIAGYPSKWQLPRFYEKSLSMLNRNLAFSVLGANARSALIQFSAWRNTIPEIGFRYALEGVIDSITDVKSGFKNREFALKHSKILDGRAYDAAVEDAISSLRGGRVGAVQEFLGRTALKPLQWLDMETAIVTWNGAFKLAKSRGYNLRKAVNFADDVVTRTQASALAGDLAPIQRSVLGKTFTLFQTFVINDWGFLTRDVLGLGNVSMDNKAVVKKVMTYVAATTLFNTLFDAAGIQSPFPTPIQDYQESRKLRDPGWKTAQKVAFGLIDPIPVVGSARYGKGPGGPTVEAIRDAVQSLRGAPMAKPLPEALATFTGIPGVTQAGKVTRAQKRGESLYGQVVGRYEPEKPSLGRRRGLGGLKGMDKLRGL